MPTPLHLIPGAKVLEAIAVDLYESARDSVKLKMKKWQSTRKLNTLYRKLHMVRNVKTIWQIDKEVDLNKFYYPSKLIFDQTPVIINDIDDMKYPGNLIIQGTAGQGKSIFLRYLCARELQRGRTIPVFVELRRLQSGETLQQLILSQLDAMGLEADEDVLDHVASRGKLLLFLDAFDEVDELLRSSLVTQLERLANKHESLRLIITSRPDSGIESSASFRVVRLAPLQEVDVRAMIHKLLPAKEAAAQLLKATKLNPGGILSLLTTPLMLTLLVITYKAEQRVPEQLSEFYDGLFSVLLTRHDQSKPGFVRKRRSGLNDRQMRDTFEAVCFMMRKLGTSPPTSKQAFDVAKRALELCRYSADPESFIHDIKKISCLIIEEGGRMFFIHKSVAEYYSACFVMNRPREVAEKFYAHLRGPNWRYWSQELVFLEQIDRYRYSRYFLSLELGKLFGDQEGKVSSNWKELGTQRGMEMVGEMRLHIAAPDGRGEQVLGFIFPMEWPDWVYITLQHRVLNAFVGVRWHTKMLETVDERQAGGRLSRPGIGAEDLGGGRMVLVKDALPSLDAGALEKIHKELHSAVEELHELYVSANEFVRSEDQAAVVFDGLEAILE